MVQQVILSYNELFNKRLNNSTYTVLLITALIVLTGVFIPQNRGVSAYGQADVLWLYKDSKNESTIFVWGVEYKIILEEIK